MNTRSNLTYGISTLVLLMAPTLSVGCALPSDPEPESDPESQSDPEPQSTEELGSPENVGSAEQAQCAVPVPTLIGTNGPAFPAFCGPSNSVPLFFEYVFDDVGDNFRRQCDAYCSRGDFLCSNLFAVTAVPENTPGLPPLN